MCPWSLKTSPLQVNGQELLPAAEYPSQEMVECLRQIGELSDKQTQVEKYVASVAESQQEMAGELAKVEHALPQKVSKEDLNIPEDLQDQLAMLKQGILKWSIYEFHIIKKIISTTEWRNKSKKVILVKGSRKRQAWNNSGLLGFT